MDVMDKFVKYKENSHGNQALIHLRGFKDPTVTEVDLAFFQFVVKFAELTFDISHITVFCHHCQKFIYDTDKMNFVPVVDVVGFSS